MDDHNPIQDNQTEPTTGTPSMQTESDPNDNGTPSEPVTRTSDTHTEPATSTSDMHTEPATDHSGVPTEPTSTHTAPLRSAFSMDTSEQRTGDSTQTDNTVYTMQTDSYSSNYYSSTPPTPEPPSNGYGIASLVLGILSIPGGCCCGLGVLFGILGIIFGCVQQKDTFGKRPGIAIAGIVLSVIGIILSICCLVYLYIVGTSGTSYQDFRL